MSNSYYSIVTYVFDLDAGPLFTVPFPYIRKGDVRVYVGGVLLTDSQYQWETDSQIEVLRPMGDGAKVVIRRFTRRDVKWAEYNDGSTLTDHDLNIVTNQLLYITQELYDFLIAGGEGGDAPPGGVGSGGGEGVIRDIVTSIVGDQLLTNLTQLIRLIDINAESTMATILGNHRDWGKDREYEFVLQQNGVVIQTTLEQLQNETEARIQQQTVLAARLEDAEGSLIETSTAVAGIESATISYQRQLAALFGLNVAGIDTLQEAQAAATEAFAQTLQRIEARVPSTELEERMNQSSVIQGIRTRITEVDGEVETIESAILEFETNLGAVQTTQAIQATQLAVEAAVRQALAARFGGTEDNPVTLAAAIESAFRTYSDTTSTTAQAVRVLQANRQPIFFRRLAPDHRASEFDGTTWENSGFPEGSMWYRDTGDAPGFYVPYVWSASDPYPSNRTAFEIFGPFGPDIRGRWTPIADRLQEYALGALISSIEETYVRESEVGSRVEQQLQTVYGVDYATLASRTESWINPGTGLMYTGWDLRINQTGANGVPVIAGIGLGMQRDLSNPEAGNVSSFVVMADKFKVVRPPLVDPLTGIPDLATMTQPFVIDTETGVVGIDGKLVIKGTLSSYDGLMGRLTIAPVNEQGTIANPNGMRLVLPSGRNNWNASNGASPFAGGSTPQRFLMWAGTGTMNHANAKFYVDTDGNASFAGMVYAENVSGDFNDAVAVQQDFVSVSSAGTNSWVYLPGTSILENATGRSRTPFAVIGVTMFGSGQLAGRARLEMQEEQGERGSNVWGAGVTVAEAAIAIPTGTTLTLSGGLTSRTSARVRLVVSIQRQEHASGQWSHPQSNRYAGIFIGLR